MANPVTDQTLMGTFEEKREFVRSFTMFDDNFFAMVMEDKASCEETLRVLTGIRDLVVKTVKTQYSIRNLGTHSVILDALAEDSSHRLYNIELQASNNDDHQKRVRYYQSNIDISYLDKGEAYEDLPEVYLIYMTKFDLFKLGRACYIVNRSIDGTDVILDNGVHEIYVNSANNEQTEVSELMRFFIGTASSNEQFPRLSQRIQYFKEQKEGVELMCEAVRKYGDEREHRGRAEGRAEGQRREKITMVQQALKLGMPVDVIAQLVRLPVEEVKQIIADSQSKS